MLMLMLLLLLLDFIIATLKSVRPNWLEIERTHNHFSLSRLAAYEVIRRWSFEQKARSRS